jgi:hypothetical protein
MSVGGSCGSYPSSFLQVRRKAGGKVRELVIIRRKKEILVED